MLAKCCGVDLRNDLNQNRTNKVITQWLIWLRPMMGVILSPYSSIQGLLWASEVVKGDRIDPGNPFR